MRLHNNIFASRITSASHMRRVARVYARCACAAWQSGVCKRGEIRRRDKRQIIIGGKQQ